MSSAIIVAGEAPESEDELPQAEINQLLQRFEFYSYNQV